MRRRSPCSIFSFRVLHALAAFLLLAARVPAQSWERLGPQGGMVLSLARGADGEIYLGTNDGHVFASDERVDHWELRGRAGGRTDAVIAQLAADQREPQHLFAAVWFQEAEAG